MTGQENLLSCNEKNSFKIKNLAVIFLSLEKNLNRRKKGPINYINHIYSFPHVSRSLLCIQFVGFELGL